MRLWTHARCPRVAPTGRSRSCRLLASGTMVLDTSSGRRAAGTTRRPGTRRHCSSRRRHFLADQVGARGAAESTRSTTRGAASAASPRPVGRAAALDSFDHGAVLCLAAGLDELQLRHAQILVVDEAEGAMMRDFVVRRREPDGGFAWHVPSSFLKEVT